MVKTGDSSSSGKGPRSNEVQFKYTGVRKRKWGKYVSEIRLPNSRERIWLGSYDTAEKAARAFDAAMFCLRGPSAKFNFPDDPPNIPSGTSLSPAEILVVSQQYGNSNCSGLLPAGGDAEFHDQVRADQEMEGTSPSSNSEGDGPLSPIDWSFLDMLNSSDENGGSGIFGHVSDFELFHEPGDSVYFPPPTAAGKSNHHDDEDGNEKEPYFLWSFE